MALLSARHTWRFHERVQAFFVGMMLVTAVAATPARSAEAPLVVTTILPVHSLVSGVMEGVAEPALLVPQGQDPASYRLTPQDREQIVNAHVLFMVGNELTVDLGGSLATADTGLSVVALGDSAGVTAVGEIPPPTGSGASAAWLDPENAKKWVTVAARVLAEVDQDNALAYSTNAEGMLARLDALQTEVRRLMETGPEGQTYLVYSDAFSAFGDRFGIDLQMAGVAGSGAGIAAPQLAGTEPMAALPTQPEGLGPVCVITEAGPKGQQARDAAAQRGLPAVSVDVLGHNPETTAGAEAQSMTVSPAGGYMETVRRVAESLATCSS